MITVKVLKGLDTDGSKKGAWSKRYGFIYVDRDDHSNATLKHLQKKSSERYKKVLSTNGEDLD